MPLSILFWVLMILWLIFGFWVNRVPGSPYPWERGGSHLDSACDFGMEDLWRADPVILSFCMDRTR
jgi:hypothetical protein